MPGGAPTGRAEAAQLAAVLVARFGTVTPAERGIVHAAVEGAAAGLEAALGIETRHALECVADPLTAKRLRESP